MTDRVLTGIEGLDEILHGGLLRRRAYLVRGGPGSGKTTVGLHFLTQGVTAGEPTLFINQGEPEDEVRANAASIGLDVSGVKFLDLAPSGTVFAEGESYDIFHPAEVELEPTTQSIAEAVREVRPTRVLLDVMTQLRYLSLDQTHFRRQALSLLRFLVTSGATVVCVSESQNTDGDADLQFMADGVIHMDNRGGLRTIAVSKFRGSEFVGGGHSLSIDADGMHVYPRLTPQDHGKPFVAETISSGVPEIDELMAGGIERGTATILTGPSGVGKTTLGLQFMKEAAGRGERSVIYSFEEGADALAHRSQLVNIPIGKMIEAGTLSLVQVEPLRFTADQFGHMVRDEVERADARIVMIDSISGFGMCMREDDPQVYLHALAKYLRNMGVTTILINETTNITGDFRATDNEISYLADNIVYLRYIEIHGELRKVMGVLKKRMSDFEKTMREFEITRYGVKVGGALTNMRGILQGTPTLLEPSPR
ncbi:ATPase domain-containing protein [Actinoplanes couchii]|uniref:non-specific serine/threonine protein kinase n=1 Tax=Actinoplanes couchii TaxID=403638 RepID=A0ABQ3XI37_9ACTN|nr:ATPase domain-containing protein [Actinoplanes couchii]MDR6324585.1 circadian clock protein KaiC [Actinoplanes couchii]GID58137.1 serine/threonine protein kinase [Actinoplanes couchii]